MRKSTIEPRPGALKIYTFSYQAWSETTFADPDVFLPASEPATPQFYKKVASGDLPTATPKVDGVWVAWMVSHLQNTDTVSRAISWRMKKNGSSVATGNISATAASAYCSARHHFYDVAIDDELEVALWAPVADVVQYLHNAYLVLVSRTFCGVNFGESVKDLYIKTVLPPEMVYATSGAHSGTLTFVCEDVAQTKTSIAATETSVALGTVTELYGFVRTGFGDISSSNTVAATNHASLQYRPNSPLIDIVKYRKIGKVY